VKPVVEEKLRELAKAARFALVGVSNTLIDFGVFTVLAQLLSVNVYLSQVLGYCAGTLNSYVLNRSWTFRSKGRFFSPALARFLALNLCMLALSTGLLYLLFDVVGLPKLGAKAGATAITMVVSFLVNRFWVFRE
jgi:putative flippase GtrA